MHWRSIRKNLMNTKIITLFLKVEKGGFYQELGFLVEEAGDELIWCGISDEYILANCEENVIM